MLGRFIVDLLLGCLALLLVGWAFEVIRQWIGPCHHRDSHECDETADPWPTWMAHEGPRAHLRLHYPRAASCRTDRGESDHE
ncbi:MAG: hypothetical protein IRY99_13975 [Isosphaeraceae bacterium]|nr:hypothetical protein [Isosphaeraceae bacterium]